MLGDLHPSDRSRTSFNSQISSIFCHPRKKDLYIALADRWMGPLSGARFESGEASREMQSAYDKLLGPQKQPLTPDEKHAFMTTETTKVNTSAARYVWLPIRFDNDRPVIEWRSEWSLDEFE